jgi:hypothetical protein
MDFSALGIIEQEKDICEMRNDFFKRNFGKKSKFNHFKICFFI